MSIPKKGVLSGWFVIACTSIVSLLISSAKGGPAIYVIGGAIGMVVFPAIVFAVCSALTKAVTKRPIGQFGAFTSFLGTWAFFVVANLFSAIPGGKAHLSIDAIIIAVVAVAGVLLARHGISAFNRSQIIGKEPTISGAETPRPDPSGDSQFPSKAKIDQTMPATTPESVFEIEIPEARLRSNGVYEIGHATTYSIVLENQNRELSCDAKVWIDGMQVGTWRIDRASSIRIERPVNDTGRFTFYQLGTPEANRAGLDANNPAIGLIRVKFMPEAHREPILASGRASDDGGTGLSGRSEQVFRVAAAIRHDEFAEIIRQVRLVALPGIRPLRPAI